MTKQEMIKNCVNDIDVAQSNLIYYYQSKWIDRKMNYSDNFEIEQLKTITERRAILDALDKLDDLPKFSE